MTCDRARVFAFAIRLHACTGEGGVKKVKFVLERMCAARSAFTTYYGFVRCMDFLVSRNYNHISIIVSWSAGTHNKAITHIKACY